LDEGRPANRGVLSLHFTSEVVLITKLMNLWVQQCLQANYTTTTKPFHFPQLGKGFGLRQLAVQAQQLSESFLYSHTIKLPKFKTDCGVTDLVYSPLCISLYSVKTVQN